MLNIHYVVGPYSDKALNRKISKRFGVLITNNNYYLLQYVQIRVSNLLVSIASKGVKCCEVLVMRFTNEEIMNPNQV